ncbi:MAG TPA: hypothetical protein VE078_00520, partial [Thermoanaerobaculia bacterium]|nr:hypothetical protein [Thermoanaerobaculia bacterium]
MKMADFRRFTTIDEVKATAGDLRRSACCGIDLRSLPDEFWPAVQLSDASFLGCKLTAAAGAEIAARGGWIMAPFVRPLEYDPFRAGLYTQAELLDGYKKDSHSSRDQKIYCQYTNDTKDPDLIEALARRIHDYSIDEALEIYLNAKSADPELRIVGVMGGASTSRGDEYYRKIALACRALTRTRQFLVVSGGGTGIMEAASLGAFFANDTEAVLLDAITQLQRFPRYNPTVADSYTHY